jgi:hypothetical protein
VKEQADLAHPSAVVDISTLIEADLLPAGATLVPAKSLPAETVLVATVLPDGKIAFEDEIYGSPSGAGQAATGIPTNGWTYWAAETPDGRFTLAALRNLYQERHQ